MVNKLLKKIASFINLIKKIIKISIDIKFEELFINLKDL
jgi:hypothetical protein